MHQPKKQVNHVSKKEDVLTVVKQEVIMPYVRCKNCNNPIAESRDLTTSKYFTPIVIVACRSCGCRNDLYNKTESIY